jgi:hypothetical protein
VYVPIYNPAVIYGVPYVIPGYTAADVAAAGVIGFGAGIAIGAFAGGGCCGWGWGAWNCNWHGGAVVYNHNSFYGNAAWHGGYYNHGDHGGYGYHNAYNKTSISKFNRADSRSVNADRSNGWDRDERSSGRSSAFNGWGEHSGGWASRDDSFRGWGSMRAGGFGGGRFGGGFGGFGGGGFRGGGFRR